MLTPAVPSPLVSLLWMQPVCAIFVPCCSQSGSKSNSPARLYHGFCARCS